MTDVKPLLNLERNLGFTHNNRAITLGGFICVSVFKARGSLQSQDLQVWRRNSLREGGTLETRGKSETTVCNQYWKNVEAWSFEIVSSGSRETDQ